MPIRVNTRKYVFTEDEIKEVIQLYNEGYGAYYVAKTQYNSKDYVRLEVCGDKIVDDIGKLGVVKSKTTILTFPAPSQVPQYLIRHFIRGYLDGDGCVTSNNNYLILSFVGTKEFLNGLATVLGVEHLKLYQRHKEREVNNFELRIGGKKAKEIGDWLYEESTIYLERKYIKYKNITNF